MSWTLDPVEANELQWDGRSRHHHEAYHLIVLSQADQAGWWFRYGVVAPQTGVPYAALWGAHFSAKDPGDRFALRTEFPARAFATQSDGFHIRVSKGELSLANTKGGLRDPGAKRRKLRWNLALTDHQAPAALLPKRALYEKPWPPTKLLTPVPLARASGVVEVGDRRYDVTDGRAIQAHVWGARPYARWAWGMATFFREDPDAVVHAWGAPASDATKGLLAVHVRDGDGHEHSFHKLRAGGPVGEDRPGVWSFSARRGRMSLAGRFSASLQNIAGVTHEDPQGGALYTHHSAVGDATLELYRSGFGRRKLEATFTAKGTAAFEQGGAEAFDDVEFFV